MGIYLLVIDEVSCGAVNWTFLIRRLPTNYYKSPGTMNSASGLVSLPFDLLTDDDFQSLRPLASRLAR